MAEARRKGPYEKYFKRPLDVFCSGLALIVLSPVMGVTALMVRQKLGSPVLFTQDRPGKDEKIFKLYKFRTMTDERDENGELLPDEVRLTKFGKLLRSTSLDELPSLGHLPILDVVRKFRKRKVRLLALTQSLADLDLTYSEKERIAILENFKYTLILSATSTETQKYFSRRTGEVKKKQITTTSRAFEKATLSEKEIREPAVNPEEFARLGDHLILLFPGGHVKLRKNYYFRKWDFSFLEWIMDKIDNYKKKDA